MRPLKVTTGSGVGEGGVVGTGVAVGAASVGVAVGSSPVDTGVLSVASAGDCSAERPSSPGVAVGVSDLDVEVAVAVTAAIAAPS